MGFVKDSLEKVGRFASIVSAKEGISRFRLVSDWLYCYMRYGATPSDWYCYEMYKYRHNQRRKIITRRKNLEIDSLFNPREFKEIFDNKRLFNTEYSRFVRRKWLYVSESGGVKPSDLQIFDGVDTLVIKPLSLSSGRGIYTVDYSGMSPEELIAGLEGKECLIEERVELVPEMSRLNPSSCNTVRVYSMIDRDGNPRIIDAVIRVGGGDSICDNFHAKGVVYPVDLKSGRVSGAGKDLDNNEYPVHPSTGIYMPGYQIPQWHEVLDFARRAMMHNPKARFIGWDVAIGKNGCEMIEGNYYVYCGFMQIFDKEGKYKYIKSFL